MGAENVSRFARHFQRASRHAGVLLTTSLPRQRRFSGRPRKTRERVLHAPGDTRHDVSDSGSSDSTAQRYRPGWRARSRHGDPSARASARCAPPWVRRTADRTAAAARRRSGRPAAARGRSMVSAHRSRPDRRREQGRLECSAGTTIRRPARSTSSSAGVRSWSDTADDTARFGVRLPASGTTLLDVLGEIRHALLTCLGEPRE
jgi:hypothetical protein